MAATRAPTKTERDVHTDARTARAETGATAAPMKAMVGKKREEDGGVGACRAGGGGVVMSVGGEKGMGKRAG